MNDVKEANQACVDSFKSLEGDLKGKEADWFYEERVKALDEFKGRGFPTLKTESWKYTNIQPILQSKFELSAVATHRDIPLKEIEPFLFGQSEWQRLVFVNGTLSESLSNLEDLPKGVSVKSFQKAIEEEDADFKKLILKEEEGLDSFEALNKAFLRTGTFISVSKGVAAKQPLHLIYVTDAFNETQVATTAKTLVHMDSQSELELIESFVSMASEESFNNQVSEFSLSEGARCDYYRIIQEGVNAFHIGSVKVKQEKDSTFNSWNLTVGGKLVRNNLHVDLDGEGVESQLHGLYLMSGKRHVDNHVLVDHRRPHGTSDQVYKGILGGPSRAVFNGKAFVHKDAQKTSAKQLNKNLLLSEEAVVDTKPELEIYADDVKCSHGAAVGQIDEKAIFYFKSRGISEEKARRLLSYGFASEIISGLKLEPIRDVFFNLLLNRLEGFE